MVALRLVKSPKNGRIIIDLPVSFRQEKKLEIIIFPFETKQQRQENFDPREFKGVGKLNMTIEQIDEECKKMRYEWERNF